MAVSTQFQHRINQSLKRLQEAEELESSEVSFHIIRSYRRYDEKERNQVPTGSQVEELTEKAVARDGLVTGLFILGLPYFLVGLLFGYASHAPEPELSSMNQVRVPENGA